MSPSYNPLSAVGTFTNPSSINVSASSEEYRQFLRERCRASLYFLCKAVLGFKDFVPGIHLPAANHIQQVGIRRKRLLLPRGFMKSHLATIGYPIWLVIQEPHGDFRGSDERILIANATATNAENFLSKIKSIFERNSVFQWLFPDLIPDFASRHITWNMSEATIPRSIDYPEPTFSTIGVGGAVVSRHFTHIILDDLINEKHAESPELMRKAIDWYKYTESLLEVTGRDEILVIGTRWSFNDLYSHIEETEGAYSAAKNPLGFSTYFRSAIENDLAIFPERFGFEELQRLRDKYGDYMFSCLYLNNPRKPGVTDFDINLLQYYTFTSKGHILLANNATLDPANFDRVLIIDIATSQRRLADYSAVVVVGVDSQRRVFLLDAWRGRVLTKTLIDKIFALAQRWKVRKIYYEDSAQQKLIEQPLTDHIKSTGQYFAIEGVRPKGGAVSLHSKEQRIRFTTPFFSKGLVYIRQSMTDFVQELQDFPLGRHDDTIDAFAYFPRVVRYPENENISVQASAEDIERSRRKAELDIWLHGRNPITGY